MFCALAKFISYYWLLIVTIIGLLNSGWEGEVDMADSVVKIDEQLLKKVEDFVKKNKFIYSSKKQVVNLAIIEFLKLNSLKSNVGNKKGEKK